MVKKKKKALERCSTLFGGPILRDADYPCLLHSDEHVHELDVQLLQPQNVGLKQEGGVAETSEEGEKNKKINSGHPGGRGGETEAREPERIIR